MMPTRALLTGAVATLGGSCVVDAIASAAAEAGTPGRDPVFGRGRVDAWRAVQAATRKNVCAAR